MIQIDPTLTASSLKPQLDRLFELSAQKIRKLQERWKPSSGAPVFTVEGRYTSRGWTEWTQGFQFGSAILQFDATGDESFLEIGREGTLQHMASHVSHFGVHDHGFNNVSTYGNLRRLMNEGKIPRRSLGETFLRAGAESKRCRSSRAMDRSGQRSRVYFLLQWSALSVCRHHPLATLPFRGPSTWPCAHGREGQQGLAASSPHPARSVHSPLQCLLWKRT